MTSSILELKSFIAKNFLFTHNVSQIDNNKSLIESGIIDSTGVLELVSFIEETFSVKVDDNELVPENLDTINNINNYIIRKISSQASLAKEST